MTAYFFTPLQSNAPWMPGADFTLGAYFELTAGLAAGDTITFQNAITPSGITAIEVLVYSTQLDSNATPTGAFELGDSDTYSLANSYHAARFISGGKMGTGVAGQQVVNYSNVAPLTVNVTPPYPPSAPSFPLQVSGVGYNYFNSENSPTNEANGFLDLVYTVTASPATAASTGTIWLYFTYYCVGNP